MIIVAPTHTHHHSLSLSLSQAPSKLYYQAGDKSQQNTLRVRFLASAPGSRGVRVGGVFMLRRIMSAVTVDREWHALMNIESMPLMPRLLRPLSAPPLVDAAPPTGTLPFAMRSAYTSRYNMSQLRAIKAALTGSEVTLLQGPPGTGEWIFDIVGFCFFVLYLLYFNNNYFYICVLCYHWFYFFFFFFFSFSVLLVL